MTFTTYKRITKFERLLIRIIFSENIPLLVYKENIPLCLFAPILKLWKMRIYFRVCYKSLTLRNCMIIHIISKENISLLIYKENIPSCSFTSSGREYALVFVTSHKHFIRHEAFISPYLTSFYCKENNLDCSIYWTV